MSIANLLTFLRLLLSPCFMLLYLYPSFFGLTTMTLPSALFLLLGFSEASDAIDGYLARKYNQISDFGKIFDPMTDSISRITVFLTFTQPPVNLPLPFIFIFITRDSIIGTLRTLCALDGIALAARKSGKLKAILLAMSGFAILFFMSLHAYGYISLENLQFASLCIATIAALYAIISGCDYIYAHKDYLLNLLKHNRHTPTHRPPNMLSKRQEAHGTKF